MAILKQPNVEALPGYRLIAPLGRGGFGEVWKCEAPGGLFKAVKFVYGNLDNVERESTQAHEELRAIQCIKDIRHPFLLSIDRVESVDGELVIVTELAEKNLHEVLQDYRCQGQPGLPRNEVLRYLSEAAEVLDLMNVQHGLQHLDVKPRNFFVVSNHVKVADFGLVTSLAASGASVKIGAVTPLYAAPEVFQGLISHTSDQYSLACCYMELLTGKLPFDGRNSRQLLLQHLQEEPDLSPLPEADRPLVARALAKDPTKRYASCVDFLRALRGKLSLGDGDAARLSIRAPRSSETPTADALANTPSDAKSDVTQPRDTRSVPIVSGYAFVQRQSSSPLQDLWQVTAADGRPRQLQFIYGLAGRSEEGVRRLRAVQHPALQAVEIARSSPGCLVVVHDLPRETLRDRFQKCRSQKLPGIPRLELLAYLRTVAEALDYLFQQHSIPHLGLHARNLLLTDDGLQIAEFGLAHLFWIPGGQDIAHRNARYAAPELFQRQPHRSSDQYSLALLYQELLTGKHAFQGRAREGLDAAKTPDLDSLAAAEIPIIAKALAIDPNQRWASSTELFDALAGAHGDQHPPSTLLGDTFTDIVLGPVDDAAVGSADSAHPSALEDLIGELIAQAGGAAPLPGENRPTLLSHAGDVIEHQFRAGLPVGAARVKLDEFRQQCHGKQVRDDDAAYEFFVPTPTGFWPLLRSRQAGLDIRVTLTRQHALSATPIDVAVTISGVRCGKKKNQIVQDMGVNLLERLRAYLLTSSEKRLHDRLLWPHPLQVCAVQADGTVGPPIDCRGKDISMNGIGFYLPHNVPTSQVVILLPACGDRKTPFTVPATLVRVKRCADGWYDVGALFRLATLRRSSPEICMAQ